jgi:TPP-dependent pyruvate/acetoin dehydrogenase alpha subunit
VSQADVDEIETSVAATVDDAVTFADAGDLEPIEELTRFVYSEVR